ncbi:MAG: glycosyltransferase [Verrucomicrobiales bacterium]|nr:glycosyltransferase [Verrucomicrobiales bacterium]
MIAPPSKAVSRITFLIRDFGYGGAQRQLLLLATGLVRRGFVCTVIHFYPGPLLGEFHAAGVSTVAVEKKGRWDLIGFFFRLRRTVVASRPEVLQAYLTESNALSVLLRPWLPGVKIVWGIRDSESDAAHWGWLGRASARTARWLSRFAHALIANSEAGRDWYAERGYPRDRLHVVANGIDAARFAPVPTASNSESSLRTTWLQRKNRLDAPDLRIIGHIGRLHPMKGHRDLFAALALLNFSERQRLLVVLIGTGTMAHRRELELAEKDANLGDVILWQDPITDMPPVYQALDAVVLPSTFGEGFPNVVAEAMASALPVIATDVGDTRKLMNSVGLLVPPQDPAALADALRQFLSWTPEECRSVGEASQAHIQSHYSTTQLEEKTLAIYQLKDHPADA